MLLRPATLTLTLLAGGVLLAGEIRADDAGIEFFEKQVRPILVARCYDCHSGKLADGETEPKANLRLDSRAAALKGGDTGPAPSGCNSCAWSSSLARAISCRGSSA